MKYDGVSASVVTCRYMDYTDKSEITEVRFFVPSAYLRSADSISRLFIALRERYLPGLDDELYREHAWNSWHIISIADADGYVMPGLGDGEGDAEDILDIPSQFRYKRCERCQFGRIGSGYCSCRLGRDLERIESRMLNPVGGEDE